MKRTLRLASLVAALLLVAGLASRTTAHAGDESSVSRVTAEASGPNGDCDRWLGLTP